MTICGLAGVSRLSFDYILVMLNIYFDEMRCESTDCVCFDR